MNLFFHKKFAKNYFASYKDIQTKINNVFFMYMEGNDMAFNEELRNELADEMLEEITGGKHELGGKCPKGGSHDFAETNVKVLKKKVLKCRKCGKRIASPK